MQGVLLWISVAYCLRWVDQSAVVTACATCSEIKRSAFCSLVICDDSDNRVTSLVFFVVGKRCAFCTLVTSQGPHTAGRTWDWEVVHHLATVPISRAVISISFYPLRRVWLEKNGSRRWCEASCHLMATGTWKPWCHGCGQMLGVCGGLMCTTCHVYFQVRTIWPASECLLPYCYLSFLLLSVKQCLCLIWNSRLKAVQVRTTRAVLWFIWFIRLSALDVSVLSRPQRSKSAFKSCHTPWRIASVSETNAEKLNTNGDVSEFFPP
jgi:hypothetical protein